MVYIIIQIYKLLIFLNASFFFKTRWRVFVKMMQLKSEVF